jgi:hypothetical protein
MKKNITLGGGRRAPNIWIRKMLHPIQQLAIPPFFTRYYIGKKDPPRPCNFTHHLGLHNFAV